MRNLSSVFGNSEHKKTFSKRRNDHKQLLKATTIEKIGEDMSENFRVPEPEWILERNGNGHLFWRRDNNDQQNSRVKFKHDVEIKEFYRNPYELLEPAWAQEIESSPNIFTMSFTCLVCVTVSLLLPWYLLGGAYY